MTYGRLTHTAFRFKGDVRKCDESDVDPNRQHSGRPAYSAPTALKALALAVALAGAHSAAAPFFWLFEANCGLRAYGV